MNKKVINKLSFLYLFSTDRAQGRYHFALKLNYAKLILCYGKVVLMFIDFENLLIVIN
jgi:hypothetical protein